jgi:hypothetical protein
MSRKSKQPDPPAFAGAPLDRATIAKNQREARKRAAPPTLKPKDGCPPHMLMAARFARQQQMQARRMAGDIKKAREAAETTPAE